METADPAGSAELLSTMLGLARDGNRVRLPGAEIVFEPGPRELITAMTLSGGDREPADLGGLTARFTG
ncbi:hypothetical protein [Prauserella cavernicola]|uniref:Uncharacterized protein n=1 Tax=Prauserella cavernicola TaxID=2800127 RepID=A0A934QZB3_9PSEU|nr:hypothetical protein [Prauserella cavernicola]MBK1789378.1 hypothetical protein [Prauserella cavernicola]